MLLDRVREGTTAISCRASLPRGGRGEQRKRFELGVRGDGDAVRAQASPGRSPVASISSARNRPSGCGHVGRWARTWVITCVLRPWARRGSIRG